ncbi:acetyl-CoA carboxylase biotin carboxyl carrier protein [bacterium LRH843]|nr:acetyl-CoA carboxylase biotin carboxyl carrier protein [bacterium LRH843]
MLKVQEIKELIRALDQSNVDELKFEQDGGKIVLKKNQQSVVMKAENAEPIVQANPVSAPELSAIQTVQAEPAAPVQKESKQVQQENTNTHTIISPMVGTFYAAPSPESAPFVKSGDRVEDNSVVCIVEAMKLMNEIEAEVKGKVVTVLAENGELVEYGQPLFVVELV